MGTVVDGRWRIDSLLGWGSTSAVYEATHRNGHRAALKILHQSLCAEPAMTERFLREAGIANAIKHRAIVPIRDDGTTEEGAAYLVLELLEGETLDTRRESAGGRIALEDFAQVFEELMSAISAVHAAGVVHRDLKPQNVFITKSGELKLLDFGTARIFDRAAGSALSVQGLVIGTPAFMSPEQARGARAEVDAQSDVWSLGAMIFTLLSGENVHAARDAHAQLLAAASKPARSLASVAPSVDDRVAAVVDKALSYQKKDRWPDVQAMRIAFRTAVVTAVPTMRDLEAFADVMVDDEPLADDDVTPGTVSMSDPALVTASATALLDAESARDTDAAKVDETPAEGPVAEDLAATAHSESEAPVTSTQGRPRVRSGLPVSALVIGLGAMAAAVLLVVFFLSGADEPSRASASAATPAQVEAPKTAASPSPSFIVISAPDDPTDVKTSSTAAKAPIAAPRPALASTSPTPKAEAGAAPASEAPTTPAAPVAPPAPPPDTESAAKDPANTVSAPANEQAARSGPGSGGPVADPPLPKGGAAPSANDVELP